MKTLTHLISRLKGLKYILRSYVAGNRPLKTTYIYGDNWTTRPVVGCIITGHSMPVSSSSNYFLMKTKKLFILRDILLRLPNLRTASVVCSKTTPTHYCSDDSPSRICRPATTNVTYLPLIFDAPLCYLYVTGNRLLRKQKNKRIFIRA